MRGRAEQGERTPCRKSATCRGTRRCIFFGHRQFHVALSAKRVRLSSSRTHRVQRCRCRLLLSYSAIFSFMTIYDGLDRNGSLTFLFEPHELGFEFFHFDERTLGLAHAFAHYLVCADFISFFFTHDKIFFFVRLHTTRI